MMVPLCPSVIGVMISWSRLFWNLADVKIRRAYSGNTLAVIPVARGTVFLEGGGTVWWGRGKNRGRRYKQCK